MYNLSMDSLVYEVARDPKRFNECRRKAMHVSVVDANDNAVRNKEEKARRGDVQVPAGVATCDHMLEECTCHASHQCDTFIMSDVVYLGNVLEEVCRRLARTRKRYLMTFHAGDDSGKPCDLLASQMNVAWLTVDGKQCWRVAHQLGEKHVHEHPVKYHPRTGITSVCHYNDGKIEWHTCELLAEVGAYCLVELMWAASRTHELNHAWETVALAFCGRLPLLRLRWEAVALAFCVTCACAAR